MIDAAERPSRERAELRLLPHAGLLRSGVEAGRSDGRAEAREPLRLRRGRSARRRRSGRSPTARCSSSCVGQTFHGTPRVGARSTRRRSAQRAERRLRRERRASTCCASAGAQIDFPLMVPTVIERSSWIDCEMPIRVYWIDPDKEHKAVRLVYRIGLERVLGRPDDRLGRRAGARRPELRAARSAAGATTSTTTARSCTWSCCAPTAPPTGWSTRSSTASRTRR